MIAISIHVIRIISFGIVNSVILIDKQVINLVVTGVKEVNHILYSGIEKMAVRAVYK